MLIKAPDEIQQPFVDHVHDLERLSQDPNATTVYTVDPYAEAVAMIEAWYPEDVAAHRFGHAADDFMCVIDPYQPQCDSAG
ncbi:MAG: hypothetical protein ACRD29_21220 [Acidimicrobiales bacterium]